MVNSTVKGFLNASTSTLDGDALLDFLHDWIKGITGLPGALIRPRWQAEPANLPARGVDWVAFGISKRIIPTFASVYHDGTCDGQDRLSRHEELVCLASFYGPNADFYLGLFRDGMLIEQNRAFLLEQNMDVIGSEDAVTMPELVKEQWLYRVDLHFALRRQIVKTYDVLNIVELDSTIIPDLSSGDFVLEYLTTADSPWYADYTAAVLAGFNGNATEWLAKIRLLHNNRISKDFVLEYLYTSGSAWYSQYLQAVTAGFTGSATDWLISNRLIIIRNECGKFVAEYVDHKTPATKGLLFMFKVNSGYITII